jgi:hypothetical protein
MRAATVAIASLQSHHGSALYCPPQSDFSVILGEHERHTTSFLPGLYIPLIPTRVRANPESVKRVRTECHPLHRPAQAKLLPIARLPNPPLDSLTGLLATLPWALTPSTTRSNYNRQLHVFTYSPPSSPFALAVSRAQAGKNIHASQ